MGCNGPAGSTTLRGRLVSGGSVVEDAVLVLAGDRISHVGPAAEHAPPRRPPTACCCPGWSTCTATVAPAARSPTTARTASAGRLHTDADAATTTALIRAAGQRLSATHLFNDMPPLLSRAPGPVGACLAAAARGETLTEQTRVDNARFFGGDVEAVPRHVLTQGLGTIGDAEHLVLVATGRAKAAAVAAATEGPVTASCPASVLQLHPHVTVVVDEGAASAMQRADYARCVLAHKLPAQGW